jgi:hypothetical protein
MPLPQPPPATPVPVQRWRWNRWLAALVWAALVAAVYAVYLGLLPVPKRLNPWAPLDVAAAPNFLTSAKLARARSDPQRCLAALAQTGMSYSVLPDRVTGPGCGFSNAVLVREAGVRLGAPVSLSCPMALSFAMWERHALQPAARLRTGHAVVAIDHLGSYACRNINRGEGAPAGASPANRSQHATADALDIAGFTLASGKRITLLRQWLAEDADTVAGPDALFLRDAHRGACRYFKGVLGPDYNAVHSDHFHLETGGHTLCR